MLAVITLRVFPNSSQVFPSLSITSKECIIQECTSDFETENLLLYLPMYKWSWISKEAVGCSKSTRNVGLLSPTNLGWPCNRPRQYAVGIRCGLWDLPNGVESLRSLLCRPTLGVECFFMAPQAGAMIK